MCPSACSVSVASWLHLFLFLLSHGSSNLCHFCSFNLDIAGAGKTPEERARLESSKTAGSSHGDEGSRIDHVISPSRGKNYDHIRQVLQGDPSSEAQETRELDNPSADSSSTDTEPELAVHLAGQLIRSDNSADSESAQDTEEVSSSEQVPSKPGRRAVRKIPRGYFSITSRSSSDGSSSPNCQDAKNKETALSH